MNQIIVFTDDNHDADTVIYTNDQDVRIGYGFRGKKDLRIHIVMCPKCDHENYAIQVAEGPCYFCGFDPNLKTS